MNNEVMRAALKGFGIVILILLVCISILAKEFKVKSDENKSLQELIVMETTQNYEKQKQIDFYQSMLRDMLKPEVVNE